MVPQVGHWARKVLSQECTPSVLNWSLLGFCPVGLEPAHPQQKSVWFAKRLAIKSGRQAIDWKEAQIPRKSPSGVYAHCLDGGSGEQPKAIIQHWPLNQEIKIEKCPAPLQNSMWPLSTFTISRDVPELLTDKMNTELLHLFMLQNYLKQHLALWRVTVTLYLLTQRTVARKEPHYSFNTCFSFYYKHSNRVRTRTWVHSVLKSPALFDHFRWWREHPGVCFSDFCKWIKSLSRT